MKQSSKYDVLVTLKTYGGGSISVYKASFDDFQEALINAVNELETSKYEILDSFVYDQETKEICSVVGVNGLVH